ncbi:hypothetical protein ACCF70_000677 [Vibrio parahaemolyticus]|uniref:hypothetical protein n=1 Tax=Vibrio parahaemolyticus TaxID=670 RepID=UPI00112072A2|nr:hypothetical protein [Vibrio parahaemolyticus]EJY0897393.1 hypothetical protein [Vibrio parahaemolyticus]ELA7345055.1 hypothetical protein [Vibrio parahaemolyticus]
MEIKLTNHENLDLESLALGFFRMKGNITMPCFYSRADENFDSMGRYIGNGVFIPVSLEQFSYWLLKYQKFEAAAINCFHHDINQTNIELDLAWLEASRAVKKFATYTPDSTEHNDPADDLGKLGIGPRQKGREEKRSVYGYAVYAYIILNNKSLNDCRELASMLGYKTEDGEDFTRQLRLCMEAFAKYVNKAVSSLNVPKQLHNQLDKLIVYQLFQGKKHLLDLPTLFISELEQAHEGLNTQILALMRKEKDQN